MTKIRKAVLPVAGLGTRVLPATKSIPKEMLPVFDRPAIQYVVDEALEAGIEHIVFVTGRNKGTISRHAQALKRRRGKVSKPKLGRRPALTKQQIDRLELKVRQMASSCGLQAVFLPAMCVHVLRD